MIIFAFCLFPVLASTAPTSSETELPAEAPPIDQDSSTETTPDELSPSEPDTAEPVPEETEKKRELESAAPESSAMSIITPNGEEIHQDLPLPIPEISVFTGAATYKYPIQVPPGRNGMQPDLTLSYNHYLKNGPIGMGWVLDMGSIRRSTKFGLDYENNATFNYDRNGTTTELVPQTEWGTGYYGAKTEELFTKYYYDQAGNTWIATTREGTKYYYGQTSASRQKNSYGTFKWHLDKIEDTNDNYLEITYIEDNGQLLISRIDYAKWERSGYTPLNSTNSIQFFYETRTDQFVQYTSKSRVQSTQRLARIETHAFEGLARKYLLTYETSPTTLRSRLKSIQIEGSVPDSFLPPTTFTYNDSSYGDFGGTQTTTLNENISGGRIAELNRDGLVDLMAFWNYKAYCITSNGDGTFDVPPSYCVNMSSPRLFADFNGDGYSDFMRGGNWAWHTSWFSVTFMCGNGSFCGGGTTYFDADIIKEHGEWIPAELDGDGNRDLLYHDGEGKSYLFYSNGDGSFTGPECSGWPCYLYISLKPKIMADFNGDGLTDSVTWKLYNSQHVDSRITVTFSRGDGSFETGGTTYFDSDILYYEDGDHGGYFTTAEVNGDGLTDIIYTGDYKKYYFLSKADGTFTAPAVNEFSTGAAHSMVDVNNDGFSDSVWEDAGFSINYIYCQLSTNGGQPDVLTQVTTSKGAIATIEYQKATESLGTELPFPLYTVKSITLDDGIEYIGETEGNDQITQYEYEDGLYDYSNRELLGFEKVRVTNPDGTISHMQFLQGEFNKGKIDHITLKDSTATTTLTETDYVWSEAPMGDNAMFVSLEYERTDHYDGSTNVWVRKDYTYDDRNGFVETVTTSGTDADGISTSYNLINETSYVDKGDWVWRMQDEMLKFEGDTTPTRHTKYLYMPDLGNLQYTQSMHYPDGVNPSIYSTIEYAYDLYGNMSHKWDEYDNLTEYFYEATSNTYPETIIYPQTCCGCPGGCVDHVIRFTHDQRYGEKTSQRDESGFWTYYGHDVFGRPEYVEHPDGGRKTVWYYDDVSPRLKIVEILENVATQSTIDTYLFYDGLDRVIQKVTFGEDDQKIVRKTQYDYMGRVSNQIGPFFAPGFDWEQAAQANHHFVETTYDDRSRIETVHSPHGQYPTEGVTTEYHYDGFATKIIDPDGKSKDERRDYLGNITEVIESGDMGNYTTYFTYNAANDLLTVTDASGNITSITYDKFGRKTDMDDPDMGEWSYTYYLNGNLHTQTDAKGNTITFTYDELQRVLTKSYSTGAPTVTYEYDQATNGIGRLYSIDNSTVLKTINSYDEMGRKTEESKTITGSTAYTTGFLYDQSGKLASTTYHGGYQVNYYYYDGTGLLESVVGITDMTTYAKFENYQPNGKIGKMDCADGNTSTTYSYDPESFKLTSILAQKVDGNGQPINDIQERNYLYSQAGDIKQIVDGVNNVTYTYNYDALHRLETETSTAHETIAYSYDPIGNITSKTVGMKVYGYSYDYTDHVHAVSKITVDSVDYNYTYDNNGNMLAGPDFSDPLQVATRAIGYNDDNMPEQITHTKGPVNIVTDFVYDGENVRSKKSVNGGDTTYYINELYEVTNGVPVKYIFAGNLRIAQVHGNGTYYFSKDHLGSSTSTLDENGNILETIEYTGFGEIRSHTGLTLATYLFTDQELDAESGLYNYDARLYDPVVGRFITADSIVPNSYNPQSLNRYAYCYNNPLRYKDPSGHFAIGIGIGAVAGGISGAIAGIQGSNSLASAIIGGIAGGAAGALAGGIVGAVAPQASTTAAATTVGAISGALGGVTGGSAARGTVAALDANAKNANPVEAAIDAAVDPSSMVADGLVGAASGAMGGMANAAAGFSRMGQVAGGIVQSSTGRAGNLAAGVAIGIGNSAGGGHSVDTDNDGIGSDGSGSGGGFDGAPELGL